MLETPKSKNEPNGKRGLGWKAERVGAAAANALWEHVDNPDAPPPFDTLFDANLGKFARTHALFAVLRDVVPDMLFNKVTGDHFQYRGENLPFDPKRYQFEARKIGAGAECNVYKLTSLDPEYLSFVIKIDNGPRRDVDTLIARGKKIRSEYEEIKGWYQGLPGLIPEEMQIISKGPRGGRNALLTVQEYVGTAEQIHDFFRGYRREELIGIMETDEELRDSFLNFSRITLDRAETYDEVIDTLGDRNVLLVDQADGRRVLRLLDPHVVKYPKRPVNESEGRQIRADLDFLRSLQMALEKGKVEDKRPSLSE